MGEANRLLAVGLSHKTAPVEVRERLAFDDAMVGDILDELRREHIVEEAMLLSTCNRVELYAVSTSDEALQEWFGGRRGPSGARIDEHLYWHRGPEAVRHLFRVASSLDSLVLGEPQILGQVKNAVRLAQERSSLGRLLTPLVQRSLSVAKKVRTQTEIGRSRVGIGNAGVDLALQIFGGLEGKKAMLLGVGEMGRQVSRALLNAGLDELIITNRTFERSVALAEEHGFTPLPWERMAENLERSDIVIVATGANSYVVNSEMVRRALKARRYRTLFIVDLAVPRNVCPSVGDLDDAYLFNVDDLSQVMDSGRKAREIAAKQAVALVNAEADRFVQSLQQVAIHDDLRSIMVHAEQLRKAEIARSKRFVSTLDETQTAALDALTKSIVKKLLHRPLTSVRRASISGDADAVKAMLDAWKEKKK